MSKTVAGFVVSYPFFKSLSERMIRKNKAPSEKPMELSHIQETSPANFLPQNIPAMQQAQLTARLVGLDFSDFHFFTLLKYIHLVCHKRSALHDADP